MSIELSDKEANKLYWAELNEKCIKCSHKCKQSAKVIQIICPKFDKIGE